MDRKFVIAGVVMAAAVVAAVVIVRGGKSPADAPGAVDTGAARRPGSAMERPANHAEESALGKGKRSKPTAEEVKALRAQRRAMRQTTEDRTDLTPDEKRVMLAIEKALDDESLDDLKKALPEAAASKNVEIRSDLVDALGWFGKEAMNDLLPFMADPDEDVRSSAIDNWTSALGEISHEKTRADVIESAMMVVDDEDALESMTMELNDLDELIAIQTIINVVESGKAPPEAVAAAREEYEFITGEDYTNVEDANKWMEENYDSPGDDAAGPKETAGQREGGGLKGEPDLSE